jgi:hypothetical protein
MATAITTAATPASPEPISSVKMAASIIASKLSWRETTKRRPGWSPFLLRERFWLNWPYRGRATNGRRSIG